MTVLDIDAGNTRLKWRQLSGDVVIASGAVTNTDITTMVENISQQVIGSIDLCRLSSVRGRGTVQKLSSALREMFSVAPRQLKPECGVGGLFVEGVDPARLGNDRWLAMLGARKLYPEQAVMVVDSGTALTLDVVAEDGRFCGGLICPGLQTMLNAMARSADLLVLPEKPDVRRGLTFKSIQAVQNGALSMAVSLIEKEVERFGREIVVVLCGGDSGVLAENLNVTVHLQPDLIFEGLNVALPYKNGRQE